LKATLRLCNINLTTSETAALKINAIKYFYAGKSHANQQYQQWARTFRNQTFDSAPVSPRQGSPVPRELLPTHIEHCKSSATSIFQPPPSCHTMTSSQHARTSGILHRRSNGLECAAWRSPRPVAQCRQFPEEAKDASVSECTWTLSALEALHNALYKFKTYLLTISWR